MVVAPWKIEEMGSGSGAFNSSKLRGGAGRWSRHSEKAKAPPGEDGAFYWEARDRGIDLLPGYVGGSRTKVQKQQRR
jgi:hypothetical protein